MASTSAGKARAAGFALLLTFASLTFIVPGTLGSEELPAFGEVVDPATHGTTYVLATPSSFDAVDTASNVAYVDANGNGSLDGSESVYIAREPNSTVSGNDVRIANPVTGGLGSQVRASHPDFGNSLTPISGEMAFFDADGDAAFTAGDTLALDSDADGSVSPGDVILTGQDVGQVVTSSHPLVAASVMSYPGALLFFDGDGDDHYDSADHLYLDSDQDEVATVQDVPLGTRSFGQPLTPSSNETTFVLETPSAFDPDSPSDTIAYVDDDNDGQLDPDEAVYVAQDPCGSVSGNDVRIANPVTGGLGSQVRASHADFGDPLTAPCSGSTPSTMGFLDADGDDMFSAGDTAFVDRDGDGTVSVRDVVLSGPDAGTVVESSYNLLWNSLGPYDGVLRFLDSDGGAVYDHGDVLYLDSDLDDLATVQDIPLGTVSFGAPLGPTDAQTTFVFATPLGFDSFDPAENFAYVDDDGDGALDTDESVYLAQDPFGEVSGNDVRMANPVTGGLGSQVRASHSDFGIPLTADFGGSGKALSLFDADGDGVFSTGDVLILDADGDWDVSIHDLVLSGPDAGTVVDSSYPLLNNAVADHPGQLRFLDADGDRVYDTGDTFYVDSDGDGLATVQDVAFGVGTTSPPPDGNETDTDGDGVVDAEDACPLEPGPARHDGCTIPPFQPRSLTASPGSNLGEITLSWLPPGDDGGDPIMNYTVLRRGSGTNWSAIATVDGNMTSYEDEHLTPLVRYIYTVAASNSKGDSPQASPAHAQPAPGACDDDVCVQVLLGEPIASIVVPNPATPGIERFSLERGRLTAQVEGQWASQDILVPESNGQPNPNVLDQHVGPVELSYTAEERICVEGTCSFGLTLDPMGEEVGTLHEARLQVLVDGNVVTDAPSMIILLD